MFYTSRRKVIYLWLPLMLLFFMPLSGIGTDADGKYKAYTLGGRSCGTFVEERSHGHDIRYPLWVTGYLTAVNVQTPTYDILGITEIDGVMLWLENYCQQHPLKDFAVAVDALVSDLYPKRTTHAPK